MAQAPDELLTALRSQMTNKEHEGALTRMDTKAGPISFRTAPADAPTAAVNELGWVIERDLHSVRHYWTGEDRADRDCPWTPDHSQAVRFARRTDAERMLTWHCDGIGRVVQHSWQSLTALRSLPPQTTKKP